MCWEETNRRTKVNHLIFQWVFVCIAPLGVNSDGCLPENANQKDKCEKVSMQELSKKEICYKYEFLDRR